MSKIGVLESIYDCQKHNRERALTQPYCVLWYVQNGRLYRSDRPMKSLAGVHVCPNGHHVSAVCPEDDFCPSAVCPGTLSYNFGLFNMSLNASPSVVVR